ncbi:hypothetical protein [Aestuariibacter salexigens]|uniref:hypothetical protein n=1 Tax=Aestuariibacter salexigens TaxID=226010 RepID=UPI0003FD4924|nr:hypothetical protein [Aestuariibacter salexigens]
MKKLAIKTVGIIAFTLLIMRPDTFILGIFIDAIGIELFFLLLSVQFTVVTSVARQLIQDSARRADEKLSQLSIYYYRPTMQNILSHPGMLMHAIPGFGLAISALCFVRGCKR